MKEKLTENLYAFDCESGCPCTGIRRQKTNSPEFAPTHHLRDPGTTSADTWLSYLGLKVQ